MGCNKPPFLPYLARHVYKYKSGVCAVFWHLLGIQDLQANAASQHLTPFWKKYTTNILCATMFSFLFSVPNIYCCKWLWIASIGKGLGVKNILLFHPYFKQKYKTLVRGLHYSLYTDTHFCPFLTPFLPSCIGFKLAPPKVFLSFLVWGAQTIIISDFPSICCFERFMCEKWVRLLGFTGFLSL